MPRFKHPLFPFPEAIVQSRIVIWDSGRDSLLKSFGLLDESATTHIAMCDALTCSPKVKPLYAFRITRIKAQSYALAS